MIICVHFDTLPHEHRTKVTIGGGYMLVNQSVFRFGCEGAKVDKYTDSQINDYTMPSKRECAV